MAVEPDGKRAMARRSAHEGSAQAPRTFIGVAHPNIQQLPKRPTILQDSSGREISVHVRDAFKADDGWTLLSADYSQLEMRLMAFMSGDPRLRQVR